MEFHNSTELDSTRLLRLFVEHTLPYRHDKLTVRVRYSRGADFSGTCYYANARLMINLGRHNVYPYLIGTHIARSQSNRTHWWRETFRLTLADAYHLALFVYLHELYHYLVKTAKRNPRRKEAMCDRFATRALVDHFGCRLVDAHNRPVARQRWDFQDLHAFVAAAPKVPKLLKAEPPLGAGPKTPTAVGASPPRPDPRPIPVTIVGVRTGTRRKHPSGERAQATLWWPL